MNPALPLDEMSVQDKLAVLETLWDDLCTHASDIPAPGWHGEVLASRAERVREGKSVFVPLDEMKERIRRATR